MWFFQDEDDCADFSDMLLAAEKNDLQKFKRLLVDFDDSEIMDHDKVRVTAAVRWPLVFPERVLSRAPLRRYDLHQR